MSSALSITRSVNPPRATYVDWPLGRTSGRPNAPELQRRLLRSALELIETAEQSGEIRWLDEAWPEGDGWKASAMRQRGSGGGGGGDSRTPRSDAPQWQHLDDERAWRRASISPA